MFIRALVQAGAGWYQPISSEPPVTLYLISGDGHQVIIAGLMWGGLRLPGQTSFQVCYVCDGQQ